MVRPTLLDDEPPANCEGIAVCGAPLGLPFTSFLQLLVETNVIARRVVVEIIFSFCFNLFFVSSVCVLILVIKEHNKAGQ